MTCLKAEILIGSEDFGRLGGGFAVGGDDAVGAEVIVVGEVAVVAAVGEEFESFIGLAEVGEISIYFAGGIGVLI